MSVTTGDKPNSRVLVSFKPDEKELLRELSVAMGLSESALVASIVRHHWPKLEAMKDKVKTHVTNDMVAAVVKSLGLES